MSKYSIRSSTILHCSELCQDVTSPNPRKNLIIVMRGSSYSTILPTATYLGGICISMDIISSRFELELEHERERELELELELERDYDYDYDYGVEYFVSCGQYRVLSTASTLESSSNAYLIVQYLVVDT